MIIFMEETHEYECDIIIRRFWEKALAAFK